MSQTTSVRSLSARLNHYVQVHNYIIMAMDSSSKFCGFVPKVVVSRWHFMVYLLLYLSFSSSNEDDKVSKCDNTHNPLKRLAQLGARQALRLGVRRFDSRVQHILSLVVSFR